jgi:hypothetical protein
LVREVTKSVLSKPLDNGFTPRAVSTEGTRSTLVGAEGLGEIIALFSMSLEILAWVSLLFVRPESPGLVSMFSSVGAHTTGEGANSIGSRRVRPGSPCFSSP